MPEEKDRRMALISGFKCDLKQKADSANSARKDFKALLSLSLTSLVTAGNMAMDFRLPRCLSQFAREIIRTDSGVPFRPELRKLVNDCLNDDKKAKECLEYINDKKNEVDQYLYAILHPLLGTLLGDLDAHIKTYNQAEKLS